MRRDGDSENRTDGLEVPDTTATPEELAMLAEELRRRLAQLPEELQRIAMWKLEGYANAEIAGPMMLGCSPRTVERKLARIRLLWTEAAESEFAEESTS